MWEVEIAVDSAVVQQRIDLAWRETTGWLDLSGCDLQEIPLEVFSLSHIRALNLSGNALTRIPSAIRELKNIEDLMLHHNRLSALPDDVCDLPLLGFLDVSLNLLEELPKRVGDMRSLRHLLAGDNELRSLPKSLASSTTLYELFVDNNNLQAFPIDCIPPCIAHLSVGGNPIGSIPDDLCRFSQLESFSAPKCMLKVVPAAISQLGALTQLDLAFNLLESIPVEVDALRDRLKFFSVEGNPLKV